MEHGKRGGASVRERLSIQRALNSFIERRHFLCPDCNSVEFRVLWWHASHRYRISLHHEPSCPVLVDDTLRDSVNHWLATILVSNGHALSDYMDDAVGAHYAR